MDSRNEFQSRMQHPSPLTTQSIADISETVGRRSSLEMYSDILKVIGSGVDKRTRIMYETNLSWNKMSHCLQRLIEEGLVETKTVDDRSSYRLSSKGFGLLKKLLTLRESLDEFSL